jgi:hypothetical protein
MMMTDIWFDRMPSRLLWIALLAVFPTAAMASVAGHVQFVAGDVRIVDAAGQERAAQKGREVSEGETVLTAANGSAQLKMIDGGILALRPDTQLKVDTYVFHGAEDGSENALLSLAKGGLRTITGLIGRHNKEKLKLRTPTAVIGIRGTDHEPVVLLAAPAGSATSNPAGTYDKVNVGATSLTTQVGTAIIAANQVGYAASSMQPPTILPKLPDFYRATPTPLAKQDQKQQQQQQGQGSTPQSSTSAGSTDSAHNDAKTDLTVVTPVLPTANLTATDASGNILNLSQQTLTTAGGQTQALTATGTLGVPVAPIAGDLLLVGLPSAQGSAGAVPEFFSFSGGGLALTHDGAGNLTGATIGSSSGNFNGATVGFSASLTQTGATLTDFGRDAATGLAWGRWQGGQVSESNQYVAQDASGNWGLGALNAAGVFVIGATQTQSAALGSGSLHWISAGNPAPNYLPQVLTGNANYTLLGGTHPTDQNGNVGTLNSASLGVNFTTQLVNASVNFSVAGNNWVMQSGAMQLNGPQFSTYSNCSSQCSSSVTLTKNGVTISSTASVGSANSGYSAGNLSGSLTGTGLNGAALQYSVQDAAPTSSGAGQSNVSFINNLIQGVAAFAGPTQDVNTPFRAVAITDGLDDVSNASAGGSGANTNYGAFYRGSIGGGEQAAATVVDSVGGLTAFVGPAAGYTPANASIKVPGPSDNGPLDTIKIGTAVNTDMGSTTIGGITVSWGRWAGGTVNIYSLDGSTLLGAIDNSNRSIHWLTTSVLSNTFANLPLTGTATYTVAGNTNPTDFKGNVGTLNSATLTADFAGAKVNSGVNVSFNSATNTSTWNLTANNIPLSGGDFKTNSSLNGANGLVNTVTCSGVSCSPISNGYLQGHFFAGAQGAILTYGMATGNTAATTSSSGTSISTFTPTNGIAGLIVMKH